MAMNVQANTISTAGARFIAFGMSLFALEASFSRLGVSLALCDALFRHSGDDESGA